MNGGRVFYGGTTSPALTGDFLTTGEEVLSRNLLSSTAVPLATGQARLTFFTCRKTETTTQCRIITGATGASATPTMCKIGLWRIATNGDGTLVAATANDTALFATASVTHTKSWVTPVVKEAGVRYAFGPLVITAGTAPSFAGNILVNNAEAVTAPRMSGLLTGLTDLGNFLSASLVASGSRPYGVILP